VAAWPWRHFGQDPFIASDGTRFRLMICYELFLPLPWLSARLGAETVGIAASDDWGMPSVLAAARAKLIASLGDQDTILTAINNRTDHNGH
jgi:predicted amidohydrolase